MNRLSQSELDTSFRQLLSVQFVTVISIIKGVTLGSAALALVKIVNSPVHREPLFLLWSASMLAVIMTYQSIMIGSVMISRYPYTHDLVMPFALGTTEFLLFSFVTTIGDFKYWIIAYIAFHIVAVVFIVLMHVTLDKKNYRLELHPLVDKYSAKLTREWKFAATGLAATAVIGLVANWWAFEKWPAWSVAAVGVLACGEMFGALSHHRSIRQMIASNLVDNPVAG